MNSPIQKRVHFIKEVSLPPLNFHSIATLRTMLNLVGGGGELRKEVLFYVFEQVFLFS